MLRDGLPLTRPTYWSGGLDSFEPGKVATFKLFGGSANQGENVNLSVAHMGLMSPQWAIVRATISIDHAIWEPQAGHLYVVDDFRWPGPGWTCIINYPIMSVREALRGVNTLLLRTCRRDQT